jgi:hypothetical protein
MPLCTLREKEGNDEQGQQNGVETEIEIYPNI